MLKKSMLGVVAGLVLSSTAAVADDMFTYEISITNTTKGQVLTPPLIVAHNGGYMFFKLGMKASDALAALAENGNATLLQNNANADPMVYATMVGEAIPPGTTKKISIDVPKHKALFSVAGMLATTNDGFFAIENASAHNENWAFAYDAGSEVNNEQCSYIPGLPCNSGAANLGQPGVDGDAEGFVHFHNGVHGDGAIGSDGLPTLNARLLDWRGSVAKVTIRRSH